LAVADFGLVNVKTLGGDGSFRLFVFVAFAGIGAHVEGAAGYAEGAAGLTKALVVLASLFAIAIAIIPAIDAQALFAQIVCADLVGGTIGQGLAARLTGEIDASKSNQTMLFGYALPTGGTDWFTGG